MREIKTCLHTIKTATVSPSIDLCTWLTHQAALLVEANGDPRCWLLAHGEDGVIWGKRDDDGTLHLSSDAFRERGLALRWDTLHQARLFGESGELLLWRGARGWRATHHWDKQGEHVEYLDEEHLLWGDRLLRDQDGFMRVVEGSQGIMHTPPIGIAPDTTPMRTARARLVVRHYLSEDDAGVVRIGESRLMRLLEPGAHQ